MHLNITLNKKICALNNKNWIKLKRNRRMQEIDIV